MSIDNIGAPVDNIGTPDTITPTCVPLHTLTIDSEDALGMQWEYVDRSSGAGADMARDDCAEDVGADDDGAVAHPPDESDACLPHAHVVRLVNLSLGLPVGSRASARDAPAAIAGAEHILQSPRYGDFEIVHVLGHVLVHVLVHSTDS